MNISLPFFNATMVVYTAPSRYCEPLLKTSTSSLSSMDVRGTFLTSDTLIADGNQFRQKWPIMTHSWKNDLKGFRHRCRPYWWPGPALVSGRGARPVFRAWKASEVAAASRRGICSVASQHLPAKTWLPPAAHTSRQLS